MQDVSCDCVGRGGRRGAFLSCGFNKRGRVFVVGVDGDTHARGWHIVI